MVIFSIWISKIMEKKPTTKQQQQQKYSGVLNMWTRKRRHGKRKGLKIAVKLRQT